MRDFMFLAIGIGAIVVALVLSLTLLRLIATLAVAEELMVTATEELRETLPEVRQGIATVNDISSGVNVAIRSAGSGAERVQARAEVAARRAGWNAAAALYGLKVAGKTLVSEKPDAPGSSGEEHDG